MHKPIKLGANNEQGAHSEILGQDNKVYKAGGLSKVGNSESKTTDHSPVMIAFNSDSLENKPSRKSTAPVKSRESNSVSQSFPGGLTIDDSVKDAPSTLKPVTANARHLQLLNNPNLV